MLIFKCANGVVAFLAQRLDPDHSQFQCTQDQTVYPLSRSADDTWPAAVVAMGAHAVQLKGALQNVLFMPGSL